MKKKSILEQELTPEQFAWVSKHPEHDEVKKLIIGARVAHWADAEGRRIEVFRDVCERFREWYAHRLPYLWVKADNGCAEPTEPR